jgi:leucyl/phenylalanyl-tRNA--protein transferase
MTRSRGARPFQEFRERFPFPDPREADPTGLLAYGGDLGSGRLLSAYASGIFPWYESGPVLWFSPDPRWVLELNQFHLSRRLRRTLRRAPFEIRVDSAFEQVIRACSAIPRRGQSGTWITPEMIEAYCGLHQLGLAHSVESWEEGELVGGVYGICLGAAFFGESMFSARRDASKVALAQLVAQLREWRFHFLDCQVHTEHLERLGAVAWPRGHFLSALERALEIPTRQGRWSFSQPLRVF